MLAVCAISFVLLGNVLVNSDATVESLDSMPSIRARGHFRNVFVKPSAIFVFLVVCSLKGSKRKISADICFEMVFFLEFGCLQMDKETLSKFLFI